MRAHNGYRVLGLLAAAMLRSQAGFGQAMPMTIPNYSYTPRVEMPFMGMPYGGYGVGKQLLTSYRDGAGSYQLPDGSWHKSNRLLFDGARLVVQDSSAGKQRFTSETVQQLVVEQDTFLVVRDLPGRRVQPPRPDFLHSCVNRQGVRLLALYSAAERPTYFLVRPQKTMQLLPAGKGAFKTALLAIVKDYPALSAKVANGKLGRNEAIQIVQEYAAFLGLNPTSQQ